MNEQARPWTAMAADRTPPRQPHPYSQLQQQQQRQQHMSATPSIHGPLPEAAARLAISGMAILGGRGSSSSGTGDGAISGLFPRLYEDQLGWSSSLEERSAAAVTVAECSPVSGRSGGGGGKIRWPTGQPAAVRIPGARPVPRGRTVELKKSRPATATATAVPAHHHGQQQQRQHQRWARELTMAEEAARLRVENGELTRRLDMALALGVNCHAATPQGPTTTTTSTPLNAMPSTCHRRPKTSAGSSASSLLLSSSPSPGGGGRPTTGHVRDSELLRALQAAERRVSQLEQQQQQQQQTGQYDGRLKNSPLKSQQQREYRHRQQLLLAEPYDPLTPNILVLDSDGDEAPQPLRA